MEFSEKTLLVHICFHYVLDRIGYLQKMIENILTYPFLKIDIIVDTNVDPETVNLPENILQKVIIKKHYPKEPFLLTWEHRPQMAKMVDQYDFFMYTEDDMLLPFNVLQKWYEDTLFLWPNYTRGFTRIETKNNIAYHTDSTKPNNGPIIKLNGKNFVKGYYQAMWIYTKEQFKFYMSTKEWNWDKQIKTSRINAAYGMFYSKPPLIDIEYENNIIYHLPNNYVTNAKSQFAKIQIKNLIQIKN